MNVTTPADWERLLPTPYDYCQHEPDFEGPCTMQSPPAAVYVASATKPEATTCETCEGKGGRVVKEWPEGQYVGWIDWECCAACNGVGTVTTITLVVECVDTGMGVEPLADVYKPEGVELVRRAGRSINRPVVSATVDACWPVTVDFRVTRQAHIQVQGDKVEFWGEVTSPFGPEPVDITDQIVGTSQPGGWLCRVTDVRRLS